MSEPLEATETQPAGASPPRRRVPTRVLVLVVVAVLVAGGIVAAIGRSGPAQRQPRTPATTAASTLQADARLAAIRSLLRRRSEAVVHRDRVAFLATVDPADGAFRRTEGQMFHNLARVKFAAWSYTIGATEAQLPARARRGYGAPTWAPLDFALHYRIAHFDKVATDLRQYPTFVKRSGSWYLGSLSDRVHTGGVSATDLWDYAPVHVIRRHDVLVLGPKSELGTMASVAAEAETAIPKVTSVWGSHWARRVVVLVPSSQHEMALVDDDNDDLNQIAALTSSEVSSVHGRPAPVGDRVTINPNNWSKVGSLGASIVIAHELTHVATRADTGSQTPKWLSEGFADYVGFLNTDVPVTIAASELAARVRLGHVSRQLPTDRAFRGANKALPEAYEAGWLACRYISERYGQHKLVRFYRAVGTSTSPERRAVAAGLQQVLGLSRPRFTSLWRAYVREQLA